MNDNWKPTRTVQFRLKDVTFWKQEGGAFPSPSHWPFGSGSISVALWLDNQKNGQRGATIHHTELVSSTWFCPVKAHARRVAFTAAHGMVASTPLSFVDHGRHVLASHVADLVNFSARTQISRSTAAKALTPCGPRGQPRLTHMLLPCWAVAMGRGLAVDLSLSDQFLTATLCTHPPFPCIQDSEFRPKIPTLWDLVIDSTSIDQVLTATICKNS